MGTKAHLASWFLRPTTFGFTERFDTTDTLYTSAGARLVRVSNVDAQECVDEQLDGRASTTITEEPNWYLRLGGYAAATTSVEFDFKLTTGVEVGLDHVTTASLWSLGATVHLMTSVFGDSDVPVFLGLGPRVGLVDVLALTPFVQFDVLANGHASYGLWFNFDWGVLEDLGVRAPRLSSRGR